MMPSFKLVLLIAALLLSPTAVAQDTDDMVLAWSDEFNGSHIDRSKWGFDVDCWGGGNDERQCYTASARNASIEDGKLVITARKERVSGFALPANQRRASSTPNVQVMRQFSSARLTTSGKAAWRYGRIEVRAKLPQGQGTWPAIWMLPDKDKYGSWAASGEIDILEAVNLGVPCALCPGGEENRILGTLHFGGRWPKNTHKGEEYFYPAVLNGFHIYTMEWTPEKMIWRVDGIPFAERRRTEWWSSGSKALGAPFDQPFYLIINLAIGGKLAEGRGSTGVAKEGYPKRFEIDWVRVWQKPADVITTSPER